MEKSGENAGESANGVGFKSPEKLACGRRLLVPVFAGTAGLWAPLPFTLEQKRN